MPPRYALLTDAGVTYMLQVTSGGPTATMLNQTILAASAFPGTLYGKDQRSIRIACDI